MDNLSIARVLTEIGDLLEIKGENPFKIRAYRNAAETISHEARAVDSLSDADRRALQGIGRDIAAKIAELIATGAIAYHQDLVAQFPPSILDLLNLPGVGPKTVALLYKELNIRTLEELEAAAANGRLRAVRGMGPARKNRFSRLLPHSAVIPAAGSPLKPRALPTAWCPASPNGRPTRPSGSWAVFGGAAKPLATSTSWPLGPQPTSFTRSRATISSNESCSMARRSPACSCLAASRRTFDSSHQKAPEQRSSTSRDRRPTTSRSVTGHWREAGSSTSTGSIASTTINAWLDATSRSCMPRWGWPTCRRSSGKVGTRSRRPKPGRCRASSTGRTFAATCTPIQISRMAAADLETMVHAAQAAGLQYPGGHGSQQVAGDGQRSR